jgi:hypothetical protein
MREKITFCQMRSSGVRGLLIYCADYYCSHSIAISAGVPVDADEWGSMGLSLAIGHQTSTDRCS